MNPEIIKSAIGSILIGIGGLVGGWFASKGYITTEQIAAALNGPVFASILAMVGTAVVRALTHTEKNAVAIVDTLAKDPESPVKGVVVTNTMAGRDLAKEMPGKTTVVAGTPDAKTIANQGATS